MKMSMGLKRVVALVACLSVLSPTTLFGAELASQFNRVRPEVVDVSLGDGTLSGQVVSAAGIAVANAEVMVAQDKEIVGIAKTDGAGNFSVGGLDSGVYQVAISDAVRVCRVWNGKAAPPSAGDRLLLVTGQTQRGQCGDCGPAGCTTACGQGGIGSGLYGGSLQRILSNPWVAGGLLAAAIAIPIAVIDDDDDAS